MRVLVIDGANVVGSRPDGWWRDRPGAAARLHRQLVTTPPDFDRVVLVLEGKAVAGVPAGLEDSVQTVHAAGSGDDSLVAECRRWETAGDTVTLVTADRGLIARVPTVAILGPGTLLRGLG